MARALALLVAAGCLLPACAGFFARAPERASEEERRAYAGALNTTATDPLAAERTYREDLEQHPHNGWSLFGLREALRVQGREAEARTIDLQLDHAWARADVGLSASRF